MARFYLNRLLRLWPTYLVLLAITALAYFLLGRPLSDPLRLFGLFQALEHQGLAGNNGHMLILTLFLFGQDIASVPESLHLLLPVRQSWSVGTELLFYVFVPALFRLRMWQPMLLGFAALMALKLWLLGIDWRMSYFLPFGNFGYFLLGFGLYLLFQQPGPNALHRALAPVRPAIVFVIIVLTVTFGEASFERGGGTHHLIYIAIFSVGAILAFAPSANRYDAFLGNISYGIYLNHFLVLAIATHFGFTGLPGLAIVIAGSVTLGVAIDKIIQGPVDRFRYRHIQLQ